MNPLTNKLSKSKSLKVTLILLGVFLVIFFVVLLFIRHAREPHLLKRAAHHKAQFQSVSSIASLGEDATTQAIGNLQSTTSSTQDKLKALNNENKQLKEKLVATNTSIGKLTKEIGVLSHKITQSTKVDHGRSQGTSSKTPHLHQGSLSDIGHHKGLSSSVPQISRANLREALLSEGVSSFNASYPIKKALEKTQSCTPQNCILPGTYAKAVMLSAADASASVNGQSNTTPILFTILGNGSLPGGHHSHLKGCRVIAEVYGDISSDRGEAKLVNISCIKNGKTIVKKINGYVSYEGKEGIRGIPVMRNGKILFNAGVAGALGGLGSAAQSYANTNTMTASGPSTTVDPSKLPFSMIGGGIEKSSNLLGQYYVKLAEQYHPIIELNAGTLVNLVFLSQFTLTPGDNAQKGTVTHSGTQSKTQSVQNFFTEKLSGAASGLSTTGSAHAGNNLTQMGLGQAVSPSGLSKVQGQINQIRKSARQYHLKLNGEHS